MGDLEKIAERKSGILLHPTSLPSRYGIGDLGPEAYNFVDFLQKSGQSLWQILPLNPVGFGHSPYQSFSAFAGNPLLISIDMLVEEGLLEEEEVANTPCFPEEIVNFDLVRKYKEELFQKAFQRFKKSSSKGQRIDSKEYKDFCYANDIWLCDYSLFMSLKEHFGGWP